MLICLMVSNKERERNNHKRRLCDMLIEEGRVLEYIEAGTATYCTPTKASRIAERNKRCSFLLDATLNSEWY